MKIIILGAGQVGATLAEQLASEHNDITLVDSDADRLRELQDRLDISTVVGEASHPSVLRQAGAEDADMLVAVTSTDEINMVACRVAHTIFKTPKKISRIRNRAYLQKRDDLFAQGAIPIDVIISPEQLVTDYINRLLEHPGALQVLDFANGLVQLVAVKAFYGGPLVGQEIQQIRKHMPGIDTRVAAIYRRDHAIMPEAKTVVEAGDEVFFIAARKNIRPVMAEMRRVDNPYKRIIIAGGGNIGERLARQLESQFNVKVIERDYKRCRYLSENLDNTIVLHGGASDKDLLLEESIEECDVFLSLTNNDEANIMACLLAKRLGARKVISLITNPAYVDLVQGGEIDVALSPQQITIGSLLTHVRRGEISNVYSLRRGAAEAVEIVAKGDKNTSRVVGRRLEEISMPEQGITIGAIVRGDEVLIAHRDMVVESDDHLILFLVDKTKINVVEKLFQVGLGFFR
ncbi:MAG: Trk system potassium transporter TrkA [Pseudomonadales bacterium]